MSFSPIIYAWNQAIWEQLTQSIDEQTRSNHALLFSGHTGLGKLDTAFAFAHHIISQGHAQSEQLFVAGSHPDLHMLLPEVELVELQENDLRHQYAARYREQHGGKPRRNHTIDQIRRLNEALTTHPHISKHRVILLAHAERLNRNAANALLKNLEEPPAQTLFLLVCDDSAQLPKTIRSRCSVINFRAPTQAIAHQWLSEEGSLPAHEIDSHLAMANNQPLLALELFEQDHIETLKVVFNDVNGLWNNKRHAVETASNWQTQGALGCVEILHKLCADLVRYQFSERPVDVFFPVQQTWLQASAHKLSQRRLHKTLDTLSEAKRLLATTVDELLVLETIAAEFSRMPQTVAAA